MTHLKTLSISAGLAILIVTGIVLLIGRSDDERSPADLDQPVSATTVNDAASSGPQNTNVTEPQTEDTKEDLEQSNTESSAEPETQGQSIEPEELVLPPDADGLPVVTNHFAIEEVGGDISVELFAINNGRPGQEAEYTDQLSSYKQEALNYLQESGYYTSTINISYIPQEAEDL